MFSLFKKKNFCMAPFEQVIIVYNGEVWFCCDALWKKSSVIGNLNESSFEEIWNSNKAQEYRKLVLKNEYPYCYGDICRNSKRVSGDYIFRNFLSPKKNNYKPKMDKFPRFVAFNSDCECNVHCVTCRPDIYRLSEEDLITFNEKIEKVYLPILKDAEIVVINGSGEVFASRHSKALVKAIANKYPNIKFCLITNGTLCDENHMKELNITDRVAGVTVSLNAATKETYDKFVINGNYDRVMKNIDWLKQRVNRGEIKALILSFVITALNYKDIPDFIKFGDDNVILQFLHYSDWKKELNYSPEYLAVHRRNHPEFNDYIKILKEYIVPYQIDISAKLRK